MAAPSQDDAILALAPWLFYALGGAGGVWAVVKGIAAFRDWLHDTRRKVEAVPAQIAIATSEAIRTARDATATGIEARAAVEVLRADVNGIGRKVGDLATQEALDQARMTRIETDVRRLDEADRALPDKLTKERHDFKDRELNPVVLRIDERIDDLAEDVKDLKRSKGA